MQYWIAVLFVFSATFSVSSSELTETEARLLNAVSHVLQIGSESLFRELDSLPYEKENIEQMKSCISKSRKILDLHIIEVFRTVLTKDEMITVTETISQAHFQEYMNAVRTGAQSVSLTNEQLEEIKMFLLSDIGVKLGKATQDINGLARTIAEKMLELCPREILTAK